MKLNRIRISLCLQLFMYNRSAVSPQVQQILRIRVRKHITW